MKTNRYFVFLLVLYLAVTILLSVTVGKAQNESSICLRKVKHASKICPGQLQIGCNDQQKIRIENIEYFKGKFKRGTCNSGCEKKRHVWNIPQEDLRNIQNFIFQRCSFHRTCELSTLVYTPAGLEEKIWFIDIHYTCISEDDVINFCSLVERNITEELHLVTNKTQADDTCSCIISENANITIAEYTPCYDGLCVENNVYIDDNRTFTCSPPCVNTTFYNFQRPPIGTKTNITVTGLKTTMFFWLSVSNPGQGMSPIACNRKGNTSISSTIVPMSTPTSDDLRDSSRELTANNKKNNDNAPFPMGALVGGVVGSVVAIAVIVVLIKYIRRQTTTKQSTDDDPHYHSPQFDSDSPTLVTGNRGQSNIGYEAHDAILAGTSRISLAYNAEGNNSTSSEAGNEYSTIYQSQNVNNSGEHYEAIQGDDDKVNIGVATAMFSKGAHSGRLGKSGIHKMDATYSDPYNHPDGGRIDANETFTASDSYSHINTTGSVSIGESLENYSHINNSDNYAHINEARKAAEKRSHTMESESPGYYSHTNVANRKNTYSSKNEARNNTVADSFDNYSHVTGHFTDRDDNYSHLALPANSIKTGQVVSPSSDVYSHITIATTGHGSQNTGVRDPKYFNVDDREYDTCAKM